MRASLRPNQPAMPVNQLVAHAHRAVLDLPLPAGKRRATWTVSEPGTPPLSDDPALHEADLRPVTILFADVRGFTRLSEGLPAERLVRAINSVFEALDEPIARYGGEVDKFMGDAIMATFGAPVAHEDDPRRAVLAALQMHAVLGRVNKRLRTEIGCELEMRIGINPGVVLAGPIGSQRKRAYTVMGDAVNVASRLEHAAPVGGIVVGEPTRAHPGAGLPPAPPAFPAHPGQGDTSPQLRRSWARRVRTPPVARGRAVSRASGRDPPAPHRARASQRADGRWKEPCHTGRPRTVSRAQLAPRGLPALRPGPAVRDAGRPTPRRTGQPRAPAPAQRPGRRHRRSVSRRRARPTAGHRRRARPAVWFGRSDRNGTSTLRPQLRKGLLARATKALLQRTAQRPGGCIVVLDDCQWLDAASAAIIREAITGLGRVGLGWLLAHRPEWEPPADWPVDTHVPIAPLGTDASSQVVDALLGQDVDRDVAAFIVERARVATRSTLRSYAAPSRMTGVRR